jgi:superfamily II DNA/RNA helicase
MKRIIITTTTTTTTIIIIIIITIIIITTTLRHACPIIASGLSLIATAETGSGKTAAYLAPIISRIVHVRADWVSSRDARQPDAVIVAPTHELVQQIAKAAHMLARGTGVRVAVASGNLDSKQQRLELSRGCDVLVASKGRLLQLVEDRKISLEHTQTLCLDEADVLLQGVRARHLHTSQSPIPIIIS